MRFSNVGIIKNTTSLTFVYVPHPSRLLYLLDHSDYALAFIYDPVSLVSATDESGLDRAEVELETYEYLCIGDVFFSLRFSLGSLHSLSRKTVHVTKCNIRVQARDQLNNCPHIVDRLDVTVGSLMPVLLF